LMIRNHLFRKRLRISVRLFREGKLARLDFKHVADCDLVCEILRRLGHRDTRNRGENEQSNQRAFGRVGEGLSHRILPSWRGYSRSSSSVLWTGCARLTSNVALGRKFREILPIW